MLREFSIPLLGGVVIALLWANLAQESYSRFIHTPILGPIDFHFFANEIFMMFFFGIAAVEITQSFLPGGDLYPVKKSINPLIATCGGVIGPALVYLFLNHWIGNSELYRGWGIPTATDIAFAWLVARFVFGNNHPAIAFLLLLAVVDDGIGLAIIAIFYPNPLTPVQPLWLVLAIAGVASAYAMRIKNLRMYWPYIVVGGGLSWFGLYLSHLHPALALVIIIPFLPHAKHEKKHVFEDDIADHSTMARFEHHWKKIVDFGLFIFGLANAGVAFSQVGTATWLVLAGLLIGKCIGIFSFGLLAHKIGFHLPKGVGLKELLVIGIIAGFGFTVALFMASVAFSDPVLQAAAKMGAMLSCGAAGIAFLVAKILRIKKIT